MIDISLKATLRNSLSMDHFNTLDTNAKWRYSQWTHHIPCFIGIYVALYRFQATWPNRIRAMAGYVRT